jgi:CRP-like cAMP-binding protein
MIAPDPELLGKTLGALMSAPQRAKLASAMKLRQLPKGHVVLEQGRSSDTLYFIGSGALMVVLDVDGREVELARFGPGRWVGEGGLIEPGPASATVKATEPTVLFTLTHAALLLLRDDSPDATIALVERISQDLAKRIRRTDSSVLEHVASDRWRLAERPERKGWLVRMLGVLSGQGGGA